MRLMSADERQKRYSHIIRIPEGTRVNALTVLGDGPLIRTRPTRRVRCDCGVEKYVLVDYLRKGRPKSCGCQTNAIISKARTDHGMTDSPTWNTWKCLRDRCQRSTHKSYKDYGGRGIKFCDDWLIFENFYRDMGIRPAGKQLDRIDNAGDYCKANCRWSTPKENCCNRRNSRFVEFGGERLTISQWATRTGISQDTLSLRFERGWDVARTLSTPALRRGPVKGDLRQRGVKVRTQMIRLSSGKRVAAYEIVGRKKTLGVVS